MSASFAQFVLLLISNVALGGMFRFVRAPRTRLAISVLLGLTWTYILYDVMNTIILLGISTLLFITTVHVKLEASYVTVLAVSLLSYFHISRMMTGYMSWSLDVSGPLMLMTAKFSMVAFDLADGQRLISNKPLSSEAHVSEARLRTCVVNPPSLFEYTVYMFDFLGSIAGPVFHIRDFLDFMFLRNDFKETSHSTGVALQRFLIGGMLGCLFAASGMVPYLSFDYVLSEEFMKNSFLIRMILIHVVTAATRFKYYFAWYMADAACLLAGLGYSPSGRDKYSRSQNAIVSKVDWATCQAEAMSYWNISISRWLRSCIYLRTIEAPLPKLLQGRVGHRQYATILTRFVSAFWHGFYPGYYFTFFSTVLQSEADSIARKYIKPLFMKPGATAPHWTYTLFGKIHTAFCLNYYGAAFLVLSTSSSFRVWGSVFYIGHIANILTIVLVPILFRTPGKHSTVSKVETVDKKNE